LEWFEWTRHNL